MAVILTSSFWGENVSLKRILIWSFILFTVPVFGVGINCKAVSGVVFEEIKPSLYGSFTSGK